MHPCLISLPIGNQSGSPYFVLTVASLTVLLFSMKRTLHLSEDSKKYRIFINRAVHISIRNVQSYGLQWNWHIKDNEIKCSIFPPWTIVTLIYQPPNVSQDEGFFPHEKRSSICFYTGEVRTTRYTEQLKPFGEKVAMWSLSSSWFFP